MTRINCIPVRFLSDKHLIAEWHEIGRIVTLVENQISKHGKIKPPPESYRMGAGHMQFFTDKLGYISWRALNICYTMKVRGFKVSAEKMVDMRDRISDLPKEVRNNWAPSVDDYKINLDRLKERDESFYGDMGPEDFGRDFA